MNNKDNNKNKNKNKKLIPLNDHAFKRMFGEKGQELSLITIFNGLTCRTGENAAKSITIKERVIPRELYDDKQVELDVHATTDKNERINIEAQIKNIDMKGRGAYYASKMLSKGLEKGQCYSELQNIIRITIFGTRSRTRDNYENYYKYERTNEYTEQYEFVLPNFDLLENKDINNLQHRCLMFLSPNTEENMRKKVIEMEPGLAKAQEMLDYINSSPEELELYEMRERVRRDIEDARKNDLQEGKEMEKIEIVLNSMKENIPIETISKITGLSVEKIQKLKQHQE